MLSPLPAVLRYRAEEFPDGFTIIYGPNGLELHGPGCFELFQGAQATVRARRRAWELNDQQEGSGPW